MKGHSQQHLWIRNSHDEAITFCIEPWADELMMQPGVSYLVQFEGPEGEFPAVDWSKDKVTVYGWSGSVASVFCNDEEIITCSTAVPSMPKVNRC